MSSHLLLLLLCAVLVIAALPSWPYSAGWGYGPSGIGGFLVLILLLLLLTGRL